MIEFQIPGPPIPQKRPKFACRGKFVQVYSPSKKDQDNTKIFLKSVWKRDPIAGPVELDITFYMPIPKATSKVKRLKMVKGEIKHTKTPDVDNLQKMLFDVMNGIVFEDDRQLYKITAHKMYGETPKTVVQVIEISLLKKKPLLKKSKKEEKNT